MVVAHILMLAKQVHRWRPVNPLCLPHATVSDEHVSMTLLNVDPDADGYVQYKGHLIPKVCCYLRRKTFFAHRRCRMQQSMSITVRICLHEFSSVLTTLTGGILHDENTFENAEAFYPERYMKNQFGVRAGTPTRDFRDNLAFGYGRRICPGMHLAKSSIVRLRICTGSVLNSNYPAEH